jgi:anti-sigma factor RsiW
MNCERIQELLLTDYSDGQLSADQRKSIDGHLSRCPQCAAFADAVRVTVVDPFIKAERLKPSVSVWEGIRESILTQEEKTTVWERIRSLVLLPRPVMAFAAALIVVLGVSTFTRFHLQQEAYVKEQVEYLDSLTDVPGELTFNNGDGFDTPVEHYFL